MTCEVIFKGRVQGVGFRYTARDMARELGVSGWVKNLPDGSVQLMAEGEDAFVEELISKLDAYFTVREKSIVRSAARHGFTDFTIEY
jgi:acylphosphatase